MPQVDLAAALKPIAAALLPGWAVTCEALDRESMDQVMPGALAICSPTPTRSMAHVRVVTPWPDGESLLETLWHELTHAALSPITAQLGDAPGAVMVEEQIVERLGNLLAKIPLAARLAVARAINTYAPVPMRARLSTASAGHRARTGEPMDPELVKAALDAIESGDAEKAAEILKGLIVAAASGGAAAAPMPATEPDGDEAGKVAGPPADGGGDASADATADPQEGARVVARKGATKVSENADQKRARLARESLEADAAESKIIVADQRVRAKAGLIEGLRARLSGHAGLPAIEKRIVAAPTYDRAKEIAETAIEMGGGLDRARAVGADGQPIATNPAPDTTGTAPPFTAASLVAERFPPALAAEIVEQYKKNPKLAENSIMHARARLSPNSSAYLPGGAKKAS